MTKKRIYLNAFEMVCAGGHQSPGLWLHEDDRSHTYKDSEYWIELAKLLEKGKFDAVFLADVLGTYDVYGGTRDAALRNAVQTPVNDPLLVVPLMSSVTKHLSFGVTASVSHEHPYTFARRMSTLDHLTKGRIGWNVVTSYLKSAAVNIGLDDQMSHDERYEFAAEYLDVCYKLWEGSWEDGAVVRDKKSKSIPIRRKSMTSATKENTLKCRVRIYPNRRLSAHRYYSRLALRRAAGNSPRSTPNRYLRQGRRFRS